MWQPTTHHNIEKAEPSNVKNWKTDDFWNSLENQSTFGTRSDVILLVPGSTKWIFILEELRSGNHPWRMVLIPVDFHSCGLGWKKLYETSNSQGARVKQACGQDRLGFKSLTWMAEPPAINVPRDTSHDRLRGLLCRNERSSNCCCDEHFVQVWPMPANSYIPVCHHFSRIYVSIFSRLL